MLRGINNRYLPNSVLTWGVADDVEAGKIIALLADRPLKDGKATAYVCENFACQAPVNTPEELEQLVLG